MSFMTINKLDYRDRKMRLISIASGDGANKSMGVMLDPRSLDFEAIQVAEQIYRTLTREMGNSGAVSTFSL